MVNIKPGTDPLSIGGGAGGGAGYVSGGRASILRGAIPAKLPGPKFPSLKRHAKKHSNLHPNRYYNEAVRNIKTGKKISYYHDGQSKVCYIKRIGENSSRFTSTTKSGGKILTHMKVKESYLNRLGITLPTGF